MKTRTLPFLAMFVLLAAPAASRATDYDTSAATVRCTTFLGTVSPKPLLTMTAQPTVLTVKGKLGGCTVSGATPADPPLQVVSAKMTAKLPVTADASCLTLVAGFQVTGSFVFQWKAAPGQSLDSSTTTFTPDSGGLVAGLVPLAAATYGAFTATGTLAPGSAFGGATPTFLVISAEDIVNMFGQCCTDPMTCLPVGKGVRKLHIAIGQVEM